MRYALLVLLLTASAPTRPLDPALVEARHEVIDALMGSGEPDR